MDKFGDAVDGYFDVEDQLSSIYCSVRTTSSRRVGSDNAEAAVPHGIEITRSYDSDVHVLNVVDLYAVGGAFDASGSFWGASPQPCTGRSTFHWSW
jgi:nucleotide-binding universal stress UspA family protein